MFWYEFVQHFFVLLGNAISLNEILYLLLTCNSLSLDEKYRFSKTETLLKLYGNLELKFPV